MELLNGQVAIHARTHALFQGAPSLTASISLPAHTVASYFRPYTPDSIAGQSKSASGDRGGLMALHRSQPRAGESLRVGQALRIERRFYCRRAAPASKIHRQQCIGSRDDETLAIRTFSPLDDQPLLITGQVSMSGTHAHAGKARTQRSRCPLTPAHAPPGLPRQGAGHIGQRVFYRRGCAGPDQQPNLNYS